MSGATSRYAGTVEKDGVVYLANANNELSDEVWGIVNGKVMINVSDAVPGRFTGTINEVRQYDPWKTMFAPFLYISYLDPSTSPLTRVTRREQMGLFVLTTTTRDYRGAETVQNIEAFDLCWLVSQRFPSSEIVLPVGTNPITWIKSKLDVLGFPRYILESTTDTIQTEMTWRPSTNWLSIFNEVLEAFGYYHLWADRFGRLVGRRIRNLMDVQPQAEFTTAMGDIGKYVRLEPDYTMIRNHVIVTGNNPSGDPIYATATNVDRDSPSSIWSLRTFDTDDPVYLTLPEDNPSIQTQEAANAMAARLLEEHSSYMERMSIEVVPYPGLDMHEPISLYVETDAGHVAANGQWWWDQLEVGLTARDGAMKLRVNKLVPFETE